MPDDASHSLKVAAVAGAGIAATIAAIFTLRLLPRRVRIGVVMFGVVLLAGGAAYTYRSFTRPITLSVAAGSLDGEGAKMMSTIASRLGSTGSRIRLKVIDEGNAYDAAKAFSTGAVDMAIVRGDADGLGDARAVVTFAHGVVLIIVPPGGSIDKIDELRGKTIGVVGGEVNHRVVEALTQQYEALRGGNTRFKDLQQSEVAQALRAKQVAALLIVAPLTEKYLSMIRALFERGGKVKLGLVPFEGAAAIANIAPYYESYELPKGTIRGSPPIPDDDLTTLRVAYYLVANRRWVATPSPRSPRPSWRRAEALSRNFRFWARSARRTPTRTRFFRSTRERAPISTATSRAFSTSTATRYSTVRCCWARSCRCSPEPGSSCGSARRPNHRARLCRFIGSPIASGTPAAKPISPTSRTRSTPS
jgi:TRAP-type uncharacterized transport system substrate-binding protein